MGKKDRYEKVYTKDAEVFADVVNYILYGGQEKVQPEDLQELDGEELFAEEFTDLVGWEIENPALTDRHKKPGTAEVLQRFRDVIKQVAIRQGKEAVYMIIGLENQTQIHYAMPVRIMLYDALRYAGQTEAISRQKRKQWKAKPPEQTEETSRTGAEFLSGITKEDKLLPVITIVILYSADPWDGPVSIHDMLATTDPEILRYVQDYRIHLIAPGNMTDKQLQSFHSGMRKVLTFIKYAKDKQKMKELMADENTDFQHVDRETARFIKEMTGVEIEIENDKEEVNMCKAWEDMAIEMKNEGLQQGLAQGEQCGERQGIQDKKNAVIRNMLNRNYSDEDILAIAECTREDIDRIRKQL